MYLLRDNSDLIFLHQDPRLEGYSGPVEEDVVLYYPDEVHDWPKGEQRPQISVGVSPKNPKWFKVFGSEKECREEGYEKVVEGTPKVFDKWTGYVLRKIQNQLMPDHARDHLAINLETGDYVLGKTSGEVSRAFLARWPNKPMFICRVDGGASIKFHGK